MADEDSLPHILRIHDVNDVLCETFTEIKLHVKGLVSTAPAQHVWDYDAIAFGLEKEGRITPIVGRVEEAMQEKYGGHRAFLLGAEIAVSQPA